MAPPSGPFEEMMTKISSSPYTIAAAIFAINLGGRYLPLEISREQDKFLNQPLFRRFIIFVIFFIATRNIITAAWLALIVILCVGYLFNENSSLCLFGKASAGTCKTKTAEQTLALTQEEQNILKSLQDKAEKVQKATANPVVLGNLSGLETHNKYVETLGKLN